MATYEIKFIKNDRSLGNKIFKSLYGSSPSSDNKVTDIYQLKRFPGSALYEIHVQYEYDIDHRAQRGTARIYDMSSNKVAYMEWGIATGLRQGPASLYMNGNKVDSIGIVEDNSSEFVRKSPLNPTMWFKKLRTVYGYHKAGWTFDDYGKIYDSDGELIYSPNKNCIEIDFDPGTKNFFRILLHKLSWLSGLHK